MNGAPHPSLIEVAALPDDAAAWAASVTPGSAVTGVLAALDQQRLGAGGQVDALVALEKNLAWLQAAQLRVLAQIAARAYPDGPAG